MTKDKDGLTPMQARFILEYPKDSNGKASGIRAGCSPKNAEVQASKWLRIPKVIAALAKVQGKIAKKCELDSAEVLAESKRIMFSDFADILDDKGDWLPLKDWPRDARRAIASIRYNRDGKLELTFWSKDRAIENGLKMTGQLNDKLLVGPLDAKSPEEIENIYGRCQSLRAKKESQD